MTSLNWLINFYSSKILFNKTKARYLPPDRYQGKVLQFEKKS